MSLVDLELAHIRRDFIEGLKASEVIKVVDDPQPVPITIEAGYSKVAKYSPKAMVLLVGNLEANIKNVNVNDYFGTNYTTKELETKGLLVESGSVRVTGVPTEDDLWNEFDISFRASLYDL